MSDPTYTKKGAQALAEQIRKYWATRGLSFHYNLMRREVHIKEDQAHENLKVKRHDLWVLETNMVDGIPRGSLIPVLRRRDQSRKLQQQALLGTL